MFKIKEFISKHFHNNIVLYFSLIVSFLVGISGGAITINILDSKQKNQLINFLDSFFEILNNNSINSSAMLKQSLINNLQTILIIWILGIVVVGVPLIIGVVILRGFVVGFTVGFLVKELGFKGVLFALLAILPQNLFIVLGIIISSVVAIKFSLMIIKNKFRKKVRYNYFRQLFEYTLVTLSLSLIIVIGSIVEAYVTPVFMKMILGYVS